MMGKLPLGVVSPYVKMSSGGCADPLKFYATSYCTSYNREGFKPQVGQHRGTGFQSNYRPMVYYQPSLDTLDNPVIGDQIKDNAQSVFTQGYRSMELPDGRCPLPGNVYQPGSTFGRDSTYSCPSSKEVKRVHFNTQDHGAQTITGLEPKTVPILHQSVGKGTPDLENYRYGPRFMASEYASRYSHEISDQPDILQKKTIGAKEDTGFTEQSIKNPLAYQPLPGEPVPPPNRSTTRSDYGSLAIPQGDEYLPVLSKGSERESGFSRQKEKILPGPPNISEPSALSHRQYQALQWAPQTNNAIVGRETVGAKEPSGFTTNNPGYIRALSDPDQRFLTTYNQRFFENIPKGLDREGWTRGGIQPQQPGGYGVNNPVTQHHTESYPSPIEAIQRAHPHVSRTMAVMDPFYRDTSPSQSLSTLNVPS